MHKSTCEKLYIQPTWSITNTYVCLSQLYCVHTNQLTMLRFVACRRCCRQTMLLLLFLLLLLLPSQIFPTTECVSIAFALCVIEIAFCANAKMWLEECQIQVSILRNINQTVPLLRIARVNDTHAHAQTHQQTSTFVENMHHLKWLKCLNGVIVEWLQAIFESANHKLIILMAINILCVFFCSAFVSFRLLFILRQSVQQTDHK